MDVLEFIKVRDRNGSSGSTLRTAPRDYFECERKITVYNARTDTIIFEAEGYMSISNNSNSELVITCKVGPNEYKKNYVYLNAYTLYAVEDITGTHTDPYHYQWYFHTEILPDVEVKPLWIV